MKAQEKELIYNLLKKASDNFYGYSSPEFFNDNANFSDDEEQTKITHNKITIETINEKIKKCTNCDLCKTRTNTVPGMGVNNPVVLV
ncbi:MAG: uracil-DNA glycosylase, partial [Treponema sp.]|nr:uracil-DNA glycosylase [Treponema sp.]